MASASFIPLVIHWCDVLQFDLRHQATYWLLIRYTYEVTKYFCYVSRVLRGHLPCSSFPTRQTLSSWVHVDTKSKVTFLFSDPLIIPSFSAPFSCVFITWSFVPICTFLFTPASLFPHPRAAILSFGALFLCLQ